MTTVVEDDLSSVPLIEVILKTTVDKKVLRTYRDKASVVSQFHVAMADGRLRPLRTASHRPDESGTGNAQ